MYGAYIVSLRLLINFARRKENTLFVDFSQAYDPVPRQTLFKVLKRLGCGGAMLAALIAVYRITECPEHSGYNNYNRCTSWIAHLVSTLYLICERSHEID